MDRAIAIVGRLVRPDRFVREDEGQDLIEYALLVGLVTLVAVIAVTNVGQVINNVFWQTIAAAAL